MRSITSGGCTMISLALAFELRAIGRVEIPFPLLCIRDQRRIVDRLGEGIAQESSPWLEASRGDR